LTDCELVFAAYPTAQFYEADNFNASAPGSQWRFVFNDPSTTPNSTIIIERLEQSFGEPRQPKPLRRERQQRAPRARRQARVVREHIYRSERRISDHLQGEPPERVGCRLRNRNPPRPGGCFSSPATPPTAPLLTNTG
jgi:hypothetical protein